MPLRHDARYLARCSNLGNQPISIFCRVPFSHARVMPAQKASRQMGFTRAYHALCEAVGVSRSAFYAWVKSTRSKRQVANDRLLVEIRAIHSEHQARYGSPRMVDELRDRGHDAGKHRVARLMQENGIFARVRRRFRHTTDSRHQLPVVPNLLAQNFTATAPNQAWVGDITYIWTAEGWSYLAVLLDLYSRRVVGWAMRK
jgi:putative transposase